MCDQAKPDPAHQRGPGDAHSAQEWVWDLADDEKLFAAAPPGTLRGESTPFYLWDKESHRRIQSLIPDVKMIAIIRDPIDRAYSNWGHLRCDGLEPQSDFRTACDLEPSRIAAGYAPFRRYLETGLYGQQLEHLYTVFSKEQIFPAVDRQYGGGARRDRRVPRGAHRSGGVTAAVGGALSGRWPPSVAAGRATENPAA